MASSVANDAYLKASLGAPPRWYVVCTAMCTAWRSSVACENICCWGDASSFFPLKNLGSCVEETSVRCLFAQEALVVSSAVIGSTLISILYFCLDLRTLPRGRDSFWACALAPWIARQRAAHRPYAPRKLSCSFSGQKSQKLSEPPAHHGVHPRQRWCVGSQRALAPSANASQDDVCPAGTRQWYICFIVCFCLPAGAPRPPPGHGGL